MIILDRNINRAQAEYLGRWRLHFKQIGFEVGRPEWADYQEIRRYLHRLKQATFFTRDDDFFLSELCHQNYCLVIITSPVPVLETAACIRRFLRHPKFRTKAQRCGKVVKLSPRLISWWEVGDARRQDLIW